MYILECDCLVNSRITYDCKYSYPRTIASRVNVNIEAIGSASFKLRLPSQLSYYIRLSVFISKNDCLVNVHIETIRSASFQVRLPSQLSYYIGLLVFISKNDYEFTAIVHVCTHMRFLSQLSY
jgi:hypothetical protein